jgi:hypothetical protein
MSLRDGVWLLASITCFGCFGACANNVSQSANTGPDGFQKGAKVIKIESDEVKERGIVTYPGGDRVDWKLIELPAGKKGRLDLAMTWTTPRPGLQLAFDVFDEWNTPIVAAAKGQGRGRVREASVDPARGKYFVRIYAPKRGDAGTYTFTAAFHEQEVRKPPPQIEIPDPPKLADVPIQYPPCDNFDRQNPNCDGACPPDAPPNWKGCPKTGTGSTGTTPTTTTTVTTPPPPPSKPVTARIMGVSVVGAELELTILVGKKAGIADSWKLKMKGGGQMKTVQYSYVRVDDDKTIVRVKMNAQDQKAFPELYLEP